MTTVRGQSRVVDLPSFILSLAEDPGDAVARAAQLFDEKPRTVKAWLYRERVPRPTTAQKIAGRSRGRVTLASIYGRAQ